MSKKRVVARSTMTLKDFHGGSIPSDLPLPSAPGMTVDRSSYERKSPVAWMNPSSGRGHALDRSGFPKQGSTHGARSFEDKVSYFPNIANIGRNYDEDERKPVDGRPRSGHSADNYDDYDERRSYIGEKNVGFSNHSEEREVMFYPTVPRSPEIISHGQSQYSQSQSSIPSGHYGYQPASSPQAWRNSNNPQQQVDAKTRGGPDPSLPNVWTARREGLETDTPRPPSSWPPQNTLARVAEASAIEKVSSGRWQPGYIRVPSPGPLGHHHMPEQENLQFSPHFKHSHDEFNLEGHYTSRPSDVLSGQEVSEHAGERGGAFYGESGKHSSYGSSISYSDKSRGGSHPDVSRIALNDKEQRRVDSNRKAEGSFHLDHVSSTYSEADRVGFTRDVGHRTISDSAWSRNAGYFESGRDGEDGGRHIDVRQSQHINETGQKSVERSANMDVDVGNASIDYSQLEDADPLERTKKDFILEASWGNHLEDSCFSSDVEGPRGACTPDGGRSSLSLAQELKRSSFKSDEIFSDPADISAGSGSIRMSPSMTIDASRAGAALVRTESGERPRLKLLPRSKPVEQPVEFISNTTDELALKEDILKGDLKQMIDPKTSDSLFTQFTLATDLKSTASSPFFDVEEDANKSVERPKLNLKPRSHVMEGNAESYDKERNSVFGGARPRELVLKERGVDDPVLAGSDKSVAASNVLGKVKGEEIDYQDGSRVEKQVKWLGFSEKQDHHNDRTLERQPSSRFLERQDSNRLERDSGKEPAERESGRFSERVVNQVDRRESRRDQIGRHDSRREPEKQNVKRDIDRQDSWRRSSDQPASVGLQNQSKENYASSEEKSSAAYGFKSGSYGIASADPKRLAALTQSKLAFGPDDLDHHTDYEDFPGKRALPLRSHESYY